MPVLATRFGRWCPERRTQRGVPIARQRRRVDARRRDEPSDRAAFRLGGQCARRQIVPKALAQKRPQRLAVPVGKPAWIVELLERRQPIAAHGVPQPHRGIRVDPADRQIFRHALREPQRQQPHCRALIPQYVALEGMDEFVAEDVIRFAECCRERQDDAAALMIGEATDALGNVPGQDGRLREVRMAGVQHNRRTLGKGMPEHV
jgi:hypothetical protein